MTPDALSNSIVNSKKMALELRKMMNSRKIVETPQVLAGS
jgi:hypothetical protein